MSLVNEKNWTVVIAFRPLSSGAIEGKRKRPSAKGELHQLPDGSWRNSNGDIKRCTKPIETTIDMMNINSVYKHKIIVAIDSDIYPNQDFLKEYDNVRILKSSYVVEESAKGFKYVYRESATVKNALAEIPDHEWVCVNFNADWICCKEWDRPIVQAIEKYGENHVYVPMFIEVRKKYSGKDLRNEVITTDKIWVDYRKMCCHALTMPTNKDVISEEDFDNFIRLAKRRGMDWIIEPCGLRDYGYYNILIMRTKHAKDVGIKVEQGWDTTFEGELYSKKGLMKVVVTDSFVLHPVQADFQDNHR